VVLDERISIGRERDSGKMDLDVLTFLYVGTFQLWQDAFCVFVIGNTRVS
jgi:hypothetical protein